MGECLYLSRPLRADEIDVRVDRVIENYALLLVYKTARTDMTILDESGALWQCDYKVVNNNLYCGIAIKNGDEWVWRWDCGAESRNDNGNEKKGEASDAFKRAGFKWGIGRELYTAPTIFVRVETVFNKDRWELGKTAKRERWTVGDYIVENGKIRCISILNKGGEEVFRWQKK